MILKASHPQKKHDRSKKKLKHPKSPNLFSVSQKLWGFPLQRTSFSHVLLPIKISRRMIETSGVFRFQNPQGSDPEGIKEISPLFPIWREKNNKKQG